ncbi:MAG: bifunctional aldolase/short-chain dehydrogenase [Nitrospirae bacterium]|nr:bifunctional aldolase/short-chain dehydrogenase [Nitrospirota bacterium]MBF0536218.1 bifunctional aldolase/short-chain dehydrogenase [Nitrospirota bacterium]MBF0617306.1 bifunctional aldolase/short-chain dehydrogenase [Nitrospirota bacterium]
MQNKWSDDYAAEFIKLYGERYGEDLALRTYTSQLLGKEKSLVLHGGGNTSVKSQHINVFGQPLNALFVKASGYNMDRIKPDGHVALELDYLMRLLELDDLDDETMINEFRTHLFDHSASTPSLETLLHAFLPFKYVDHTHSEAVLAIGNSTDGKEVFKRIFGDEAAILDYYTPGFQLAKAAASFYRSNPNIKTLILMHHGIFTWGDTAKDSYTAMIDFVTEAEKHIEAAKENLKRKHFVNALQNEVDEAKARYVKIAPILRGLLSEKTGDTDNPFNKVILKPLIDDVTLGFINSEKARDILMTPPVTSDYLIRTKAFPLWIDTIPIDDDAAIIEALSGALSAYKEQYENYLKRHSLDTSAITHFDSLPKVIAIPCIGIICSGSDMKSVVIAHDITLQNIRVKLDIALTSEFKGIQEDDIFKMEYRLYQQNKLNIEKWMYSLTGSVSVVTGAAGAIGGAVSKGLLRDGSCVALTDLPGDNLNSMYEKLRDEFGERVAAIPMDVTDAESVSQCFAKVTELWGGVDILIPNAGIAMVSTLMDMPLEGFKRLERVNVDGTLTVISEAARLFKRQATGGDIVLVSTKNVFSPSASFGAYSATKAAAHQIARVASLELAPLGVRVNMVSPDAVFSGGTKRSGLWEEIGPERMKARGLDEKGLEQYYQSRNLLKSPVTGEHVSKAVLFFVTRQTPTTGATIPVDGGLPDATPR